MLSSPSLQLRPTPLRVKVAAPRGGLLSRRRGKVSVALCSLTFELRLHLRGKRIRTFGEVEAGILSGFSGLESIPGPELPDIEFLKRWNEENQKKYAEFDSRFKSSPVLKDLLEKSKLNKAKNQRELQDKYCMRGAEWGVGDCSTQGMTQEERDNFIAALKKRIGE